MRPSPRPACPRPAARALHVLVTAGPTVEDLDPVRFLSNRASGKLGFAAAAAAFRRGHRVTLIHGPVSAALGRRQPVRPQSNRWRRVAVRSAAEMHRAVMGAVAAADAVLMTAAVADFTPARVSAAKLKKARRGLLLRLQPAVDILAALGRLKRRARTPPVLIGFALETGRGATPRARARARLAEARRKLAAKNLDAIVLDTPHALGANAAQFSILRAGRRTVETVWLSKRALARRLVRLAEELAHARGRRHAGVPTAADDSVGGLRGLRPVVQGTRAEDRGTAR